MTVKRNCSRAWNF